MRGVRLVLVALLLGATALPAAGAGDPSTTSTTVAGRGDSTTSAPEVDGRYREFGDGGGFLDILPAGQNAGLTTEGLARATAATKGDGEFPPHYEDQLRVYDSLVHASGDLTDADLLRYFKDASFGVAPGDARRVYQPHDDVTVIRDESYGVAHIFGRTRYATLFAEGYTTAEDRLFFMDVLRHLGRGRLSELVGLAAGESEDRSQVGDSPYREADLTEQIDRLRESGPDGAAVIEDFRAYADGVNRFIEEVGRDDSRLPAEYALLGRKPANWVDEDAVAIATLIGGIFGRGGGRELVNQCRLDALGDRLGDRAEARAIFDDLRFADYPGPTTSPDRAEYPTELDTAGAPSSEPAVPDLDCASLRPAGDASPDVSRLRPGLGGSGSLLPAQVSDSLQRVLGALDELGSNRWASNAVLVAGRYTESGRPIAVFGPQVGYNAPEILTEKDVHGPGIDARGVGFLGIDAYVLLGRGGSYAWSATSSGADNVDTFVLPLCDPGGGTPTVDSTGYRHDGKCRRIESWQHTLDAPATPLGPGGTRSWKVERAPDYGPVLYRGTLRDGTPVAVATRRSTYGAEIDSAIGFRELNDPRFMEDGVTAFRRATGEHITFDFNWFYVDVADIAYQHSCRCPLRDTRVVDPALTVWSTGENDWQGFLAADDQPFSVNPDQGYLVSWNNRQAPGFGASDGNFGYGPVHRSLLLSRRIEDLIAAGEAKGGPQLHRSDVVRVMIDAATVDLRGSEVLPLALELMATPPDGSDPRLLDLRERLEIWSDDGAHRLDADDDGEYDDPVAPAVMDAWWPQLVDAIFGESSGHPFATLDIPADDPPSGHMGSSFDSGAYSHVALELRSVLGQEVPRPFSRSYCGGGDRTRCEQALWASLGEAAVALEQEFGSPDVDSWRRRPADDEIRYRTLIAPMPSIDWQNRPTFQQVVQLETSRSAEMNGDRTPAARGGGSSSAPVVIIVIVAAGAAVAVGLVVRRRRAAAAPR